MAARRKRPLFSMTLFDQFFAGIDESVEGIRLAILVVPQKYGIAIEISKKIASLRHGYAREVPHDPVLQDSFGELIFVRSRLGPEPAGLSPYYGYGLI